MKTNQNGEVVVMMECGLMAIVPSEYANGFEYKKDQPYEFEVISTGEGEFAALLKPLI